MGEHFQPLMELGKGKLQGWEFIHAELQGDVKYC